MPVDPARVPARRLQTGALMPAIGLGTFGSDHVPPETVAQAVAGAYRAGYRHFDCAAVYGNEASIGRVLDSLPREEMWITSKLWNDSHSPAKVVPACQQSLSDLRTDYLDMYLVHWPFPNHHPPGADVSSRSPHARPYAHDEFMETWGEMERLVELGLVRHIGTSNMSVAKLNLLLRDAKTPPAVNEMELHPYFQQPELFEFVLAHGIQPVAFCPLGSPARPARDRAPGDLVDMEDPTVVSIARDHQVSPAAVCLKWAVQRGATPVPFSTREEHYVANLEAVVSDPLSEAEMKALSALDCGNRLIKGQVFLWREGQDWRDLWDEDGRIAN
jgi:alcohol dehydrogenase (NADP+)